MQGFGSICKCPKHFDKVQAGLVPSVHFGVFNEKSAFLLLSTTNRELDILQDKPAQKFDIPSIEPKNVCGVWG
jgi:hypothetical protein